MAFHKWLAVAILSLFFLGPKKKSNTKKLIPRQRTQNTIATAANANNV